MISKDKFNFVFVAVPKTGCSSMRVRFNRLSLAHPERKNKPYSYLDFYHPQHYNIKEYQQILKNDLDSRFKFGFVRNPWDRLVSRFKMSCRNASESPQLSLVDWNNPKKFQKWALKKPNAFATCPRSSNCKQHARLICSPQLDWFINENDSIAVDFIGRFENINSDFEKVLTTINKISKIPPRKHWKLPKRNISNIGEHYSFYYNEETIELIRKRHERDIEEFDYTYEKKYL